MVKLRLPSLKNKRKVVLVSATVSAAVVAVIAILYYTNPGFKRKLNEFLKLGAAKDLGPIVDIADTVSFELDQARVPPDTHFTIQGQFTDAEGKPVRVKQALFYVIQNASGASGPRRMLLQGSIGNDIGKFTKEVPTTGFPRGDDYDIIVSDHPLSPEELAGTPPSQAPMSVGEAISGGGENQGQITDIGGIGGIT